MQGERLKVVVHHAAVGIICLDSRTSDKGRLLPHQPYRYAELDL